MGCFPGCGLAPGRSCCSGATPGGGEVEEEVFGGWGGWRVWSIERRNERVGERGGWN